jgi:outer membrane protein assembly factor BamA
MNHLIGFFLSVICVNSANAMPGLVVERRRSQFQANPGYAMVPYAYHLPGIGLGYGFLAALTNVKGSYTDISATAFTGDANGQAVGIDSVHLLPQRLILDLGGARLSRTSIQSYSSRGMSSGKNDYSLAEFHDSYFAGSRLTATFIERRLEGYIGYYGGSAQLSSLRNRDGTTIISSNKSPRFNFNTWIAGLRLDLTDDYIDPRRGWRLEPSLWRSPRQGSGPDFFFTDLNATAYVPLGHRHTWAFNYFRSDTHILNKGLTDSSAIGRELGLDCSVIIEAAKKNECQQYLNSIVAQNTYGTASGLGGYQRLRSYPENRYKGAHSEFFGTELRFNLTDEFQPFNIYIMQDIRTSVQIALFYEVGSISDNPNGLWTVVRHSYGTGLRIVTASGLVYRLDLANGNEGLQPSIFFQYPWEL